MKLVQDYRQERCSLVTLGSSILITFFDNKNEEY